jgi:hypothetical protein
MSAIIDAYKALEDASSRTDPNPRDYFINKAKVLALLAIAEEFQKLNDKLEDKATYIHGGEVR